MNPAGKPTRNRRLLALAVLFIVITLAAIIISRSVVFAAPEQPLPFSHRQHSQSGVECLFCHPNALRSDVAGIPSVQLCVGCHRVIDREEPAIESLFTFWEASQPIPWVPVNDMPDHVFFSHSPHLQAGINCESCHGDVARMELVRPVDSMDMGWCLECHLEQREDRVARLADCLTCHQ